MYVETIQTKRGAHVVSVNDSKVCNDEDAHIRNKILLWIIKN